MDFAKRILDKYGWKEGEGLGKDKNGISKPLKASLKFDKTGFGADIAASDFNNRWWERAFNDAASNLVVRASEKDGPTLDLQDHSESVEITTKQFSLKKLAKCNKSRGETKYQTFFTVPSSSHTNLTETSIQPEHHKSDLEQLTDEQLFTACGGRTAHKGARHGLKLNGKLARVEEQEKRMLEELQQKLQRSCESTSRAHNLQAKKLTKRSERVEDPIRKGKNTPMPNLQKDHPAESLTGIEVNLKRTIAESSMYPRKPKQSKLSKSTDFE